jgi:hypothetical protein
MSNGLRKDAIKGIFCLEGDWEKDLRGTRSVWHLLRFIQDALDIPFIHRHVATRTELEYRLRLWKQKTYRDYPILSLNFHGDPDYIWLPETKDIGEALTLDELAELLEDGCEGRIIHFGTCSTLKTHGNHINAFLKRTDALAVCGYTTDILWLGSAALDLLLFGKLQERAFNRAGMRMVHRDLKHEAAVLMETLGFRMKVR